MYAETEDAKNWWNVNWEYIKSQKSQTNKTETIFLKPKALESQSYDFISNTVVWQPSLGSVMQIMQIGSIILKSFHFVLSVTESARVDFNRGETHLLETRVFRRLG